MTIRVDDLRGPEIAGFLEEHIQDMRSVTPPGSKHALDLDGLRRPEITFWTAWEAGVLVGCGALKALGDGTGEVKSMRTRRDLRGKGIASELLRLIIATARERGYRALLLETGSFAFFAPARRLYETHGFVACGPFGSYKLDPNSSFYVLSLEA